MSILPNEEPSDKHHGSEQVDGNGTYQSEPRCFLWLSLVFDPQGGGISQKHAAQNTRVECDIGPRHPEEVHDASGEGGQEHAENEVMRSSRSRSVAGSSPGPIGARAGYRRSGWTG